MKPLRLALAFAFASLCLPAIGRADVLIDTTPSWNGTGVFGVLMGEQGYQFQPIATYGQTFTVPDGNAQLTRFSIWMQDVSAYDPNPMVFGMYIMAWTGARAAGPVLYDSGPITLGTGDVMQEVDFCNLNLTLQPDQSYVAILSASKFFNGQDGVCYVSGIPTDAYPGGTTVNLDNGSDASQWTTGDWGVSSASWDTAFQAQFVPAAPEPSAAFFVLPGCALAFAGARRSRKVS